MKSAEYAIHTDSDRNQIISDQMHAVGVSA